MGLEALSCVIGSTCLALIFRLLSNSDEHYTYQQHNCSESYVKVSSFECTVFVSLTSEVNIMLLCVGECVWGRWGVGMCLWCSIPVVSSLVFCVHLE